MGIGAHRQYVDNKRFPGQIEFPSDLIKPILEKTNGVLVFQEQIQFIAKEIAGMDLGEGDNLRRALDKAAKLIKKQTKEKNSLRTKRKVRTIKLTKSIGVSLYLEQRKMVFRKKRLIKSFYTFLII